MQIGDHDVPGPDILWYPRGASPINTIRGHTRLGTSPSRSPSTWREDIGAKKFGNEPAGLSELRLVDTAADEILVFRRSFPDAPAFDVALG